MASKEVPQLVLAPGLTNAATVIQVHPRQSGNPLLKLIRHFKWVFVQGHVGDYSTGSTGIVYVELGYHRLHPNYVKARLHEVGQLYRTRVLLVHVNETQSDASAIHGVILDLNKLCFSLGFTLLLAFSLAESARYLECLKMCEGKGASSIQERLPSSSASSSSSSSGARASGNSAASNSEKDKFGDKDLVYMPRVNKIFTAVRSINKSNAATLLDVFQSVGGVFQADAEQLMLCPGLGEKRARRLFAAFNEPFRKGGSSGSSGSSGSGSSSQIGSKRAAALGSASHASAANVGRAAEAGLETGVPAEAEAEAAEEAAVAAAAQSDIGIEVDVPLVGKRARITVEETGKTVRIPQRTRQDTDDSGPLRQCEPSVLRNATNNMPTGHDLIGTTGAGAGPGAGPGAGEGEEEGVSERGQSSSVSCLPPVPAAGAAAGHKTIPVPAPAALIVASNAMRRLGMLAKQTTASATATAPTPSQPQPQPQP
jgi:DNA excision repair protein ERCC-1